jgi:hypothetical protein
MVTAAARPALPVFLLLASFAFSVAWSMPILMDRYNEHPRSVAQNRDKCTICHVHSDGSGPLTAFGNKFDRAGLRYTEELMLEYPNLFTGADGSSPASAATGDSAPTIVVPGNEAKPFDVKQYFLDECRECHGKYGDGDPLQGVPAWADRQWVAERSAKTDELLSIILDGKDKMIGHRGKITEANARELLDLVIKIANTYSQ